jgi:hypothetical protein
VHATAITTLYDAGQGTLPGAQGFTAVVDVHVTPSVTNGILDVDAYSGGVNSRPAYYTDVNGTFVFSSFVMEAGLEIIHSTQNSGPGAGNDPRAGFTLAAVDNNHKVVEVLIVENGLWMQTSDGVGFNPPATAFLNFNTTDGFHDYRVEVDGSAASLYIDHAGTSSLSLSVASLQTSAANTANECSFGDDSVLARAHYQMNYAMFSSDLSSQFSAPEPATFGFIPAAGLALWLRRRRRGKSGSGLSAASSYRPIGADGNKSGPIHGVPVAFILHQLQDGAAQGDGRRVSRADVFVQGHHQGSGAIRFHTPLADNRILHPGDEQAPGQANETFAFGNLTAAGFTGAQDGKFGVQIHSHQFPGFDPAVIGTGSREEKARV